MDERMRENVSLERKRKEKEKKRKEKIFRTECDFCSWFKPLSINSPLKKIKINSD